MQPARRAGASAWQCEGTHSGEDSILTRLRLHAQENFLRTLERIFFFFLAPGLTDHWPCDYERKVPLLALHASPVQVFSCATDVWA